MLVASQPSPRRSSCFDADDSPRRRRIARAVGGALVALLVGACKAPGGDRAGNAEASAAGAPAAGRPLAADPAAEVPQADAASPRPDYQVAASPSGKFTAAWRPAGDAVPVNELFEIELELFEGSGPEVRPGAATARPLAGAKVQASAWMPEHMHGMNRRPETTESAPGHYLVRGMMLHMEGFWQLFFDVMSSAGSERVEFSITLR
jgi:hypothetical protein